MEGNLTIQQQTPDDENKLEALERELYRHDPILVLLRNKLRLGNLAIIGGIVGFTAVVLFVLPTFAGPNFDLRSRSWDYTLRPLFQTFLLFPLIFWLYLILPRSIADLSITLRDSGTLDESSQKPVSPESYKDMLQKLISLASSRWWVGQALLYITVYWLYRLVVAEPRLPQSQLEPFWLRVAIVIIYTPIIYATFMSIVWLLAALLFVHRVFLIVPIHIRALHPDGSGGLGVLGRMLMISAGVLVTLGVATLVMNASFLLGSNSSFSQSEGFVLGVTYCVLVPAILIGWTMVPHRAMLKARDAILQEVADEFQRTIQRTISSIQSDADTITADTQRLSGLKARYELLKETYPTWPLEIVWIRRMVVIVVLPAIGAILPLILPFLIEWVKHLLRL